ncbi:MAG: PilZ domain-containing protein [Nitrospirae bacterium]|nr:PilZ domain-containing protein [Nitrospirota bacterium]
MTEKDKDSREDQREFFRIDDVVPLIINPASEDKLQEISRSLSISDLADSSMSKHLPPNISESVSDLRQSDLLMEINIKLDFLINHFLLEREGLLSAQKKPVNISAAGIRCTVGHPVKVDDVLEVKMLLPAYPPVAVLAYAEVKRVRPAEDKTFEVSLQFVNMSDDVRDEITKYILNRQRETIRLRKSEEKKQ